MFLTLLWKKEDPTAAYSDRPVLRRYLFVCGMCLLCVLLLP